MRTWSLADVIEDATLALVRAYSVSAVGVQAVIDWARTVERITRPVRRGADREDGEVVADEPCTCGTGFDSPCARHDVPHMIGVGDVMRAQAACDDFVRSMYGMDTKAAFDAITGPCPHCVGDDTPNPTEPGLDDDELVGVRGLLQERYDPAERGDYLGPYTASAWSAGRAEPTAPAEPRAAGSGPSEDCGIPTSPSEGRQLPCASCNRATKLLDGVAVHTQDNTPVIDCGDKHPDDAVAEWIGSSVPVISDVLDRHRRVNNRVIDGALYCCDSDGGIHDEFGSHKDWLAHVAPIIAEALVAQPK